MTIHQPIHLSNTCSKNVPRGRSEPKTWNQTHAPPPFTSADIAAHLCSCVHARGSSSNCLMSFWIAVNTLKPRLRCGRPHDVSLPWRSSNIEDKRTATSLRNIKTLFSESTAGVDWRERSPQKTHDHRPARCFPGKSQSAPYFIGTTEDVLEDDSTMLRRISSSTFMS